MRILMCLEGGMTICLTKKRRTMMDGKYTSTKIMCTGGSELVSV